MAFKPILPFRRLTAEQQALAVQYRPLAFAIVRKYFGDIPRDARPDTIGVALHALCYSAAHYRPETGWKFTTYASKCIWGIVCRYVKREVATQLYYSLDERTPDGASVGDLQAGDGDTVESAAKGEYAEYARRLLSKLHDRERMIVEMRFGIGCEKHTLDQVAAVIGRTRERVRQLERRALEKMRTASVRISLDAARKVG
jgi:RNA polymerase primary sigma factor